MADAELLKYGKTEKETEFSEDHCVHYLLACGCCESKIG